MLRRLYDKSLEYSGHPKATWFLAAVSFIESSIFPIPPDAMLTPMIIAKREKAWFYATVATIASVLGGLFGYYIGYALFQSVGLPMLELYGYSDKLAEFTQHYNEYGAWIVGMAGATPFPYKVVTILSGVAELSIPIFIIASVLSRGFRFFLVAWMLWQFGQPIRIFFEKYFNLCMTAFFVLLFAGFFGVKYLF